MNRTFHVIDQPGQTAEAAVLRLSVDAARLDPKVHDDQHAWLLFGGEATREAARSIGLRDDQFRLFPKPVGLHKLLPATLGKPRQLLREAHRVVCWTEGATQIVSLLGCANVVRRVSDATLCKPAKDIIARAHRDISTPSEHSRVSLREQWGAEQDTTVVALLGDRFEHIDASTAIMTIVLTHEALTATRPECADVRLLCHPQAKRRADAAVFSEMLSLDDLLIQDGGLASPWSVLQGCNVAIALDASQAGLSMLWADSTGVPVVTPHDDRLPISRSLVHAVHSRSSQPKHLADALTDSVVASSQAMTTG